MTVSTPTVAPETPVSGAAPAVEPAHIISSPRRPRLAPPSAGTGPVWSRPLHLEDQVAARITRPDFADWLRHVRPAAGCTRPIRLYGDIYTVEADTGRLLSTVHTADMPDGVIYKACGNRRASACPSCSKRYKRDAYQVIRTGLVGGKGVPDHVATHPAVFPTFTAPSFGPVHSRVVRKHTCASRRSCDCRPEPCHARRDTPTCPHGIRLVCYARHDPDDPRLGTPLCLDCYDHAGQVVWNLQAGELWRRTAEAIRKYIRRLARQRGIDPDRVRLSFGKAAEMQRRGVVHFHAIIRLDGAVPGDKTAIVPPPSGIDAVDLVDAVDHAKHTMFTTGPHPDRPHGWRIGWGDQVHTKVITVAGDGQVTDGMVAAYLAKYATKSTEITGHTSARLTADTVDLYADPDGSHTERLIDACWRLGRDRRWRRLRLWAHMLGFGGHFLTKSRTYSITFSLLRNNRIVYRRTVTAGPPTGDRAPREETTLVVNFLQYVGAGWRTPADAMLATTSATLAREHQPTMQGHMPALAAWQEHRQTCLDSKPGRRTACMVGPAPTPATLYSAADVAKELRCSEWWVKEQARRRRIPHCRIAGSYRFTAAHLAEIIRLFEVRPTGQPGPSGPPERAAVRTTTTAHDGQPPVVLRARTPRRVRKAGMPGSSAA